MLSMMSPHQPAKPEGVSHRSGGDRNPGDPSGHVPVLLHESLAGLRLRSGGTYVDATFGGGGHTAAILAHPVAVGRVIGIDVDPAARERGADLAARADVGTRLRMVHGNFGDLANLVPESDMGRVDGLLMDLGLSSFQLDDPERGFAFRFEAPLDMRFDPTSGPSAADLVATLPERDLANVIFRNGEEPASRRIARAVVEERTRHPITTTVQLAALVERAVGGRRGKVTHPATRTFQALRMEVNRELEMLTMALHASLDVLAPGGRLVVIAFHSLEDRIVKRFVEAERRTCVCPPEQPVCTCTTQPRLIRVGKAIKPAASELTANPRSRSAVMRIAERTAFSDGDGFGGDAR